MMGQWNIYAADMLGTVRFLWEQRADGRRRRWAQRSKDCNAVASVDYYIM